MSRTELLNSTALGHTVALPPQSPPPLRLTHGPAGGSMDAGQWNDLHLNYWVDEAEQITTELIAVIEKQKGGR